MITRIIGQMQPFVKKELDVFSIFIIGNLNFLSTFGFSQTNTSLITNLILKFKLHN